MRRWQRLQYVHLRPVTFDWQVFTNDFQQSAYKRIFCVFGGTISEDWSRFMLITGRTKKGHFWMQKIAETVGEFLKGDWGRSRLITGGKIDGHYCIRFHKARLGVKKNGLVLRKLKTNSHFIYLQTKVVMLYTFKAFCASVANCRTNTRNAPPRPTLRTLILNLFCEGQ